MVVEYGFPGHSTSLSQTKGFDLERGIGLVLWDMAGMRKRGTGIDGLRLGGWVGVQVGQKEG